MRGNHVTQGAVREASFAHLPWALHKPSFVGFGWAFSPLLHTIIAKAQFHNVRYALVLRGVRQEWLKAIPQPTKEVECRAQGK